MTTRISHVLVAIGEQPRARLGLAGAPVSLTPADAALLKSADVSAIYAAAGADAGAAPPKLISFPRALGS